MTDWGGCQPPPPRDWAATDDPDRLWRPANALVVSSTLYPLLVSDSLGTAFRLPSRMSTFRQPVDPLGTVFRLPASGDLRQTYFPRNVTAGDADLVSSFRLPPVGNLGTTYFPRYVTVGDAALGTAFRLPSFGNLEPGILASPQNSSLNTAFRLPSSGDLS